MALPGPVDRLLDALVVPSFLRIGFELRADAFDDLPRLDGKAVVVTGTSGSGLGKAAARRLAALGATVWLIGRDDGRTQAARAEIAATVDGASLRVGIADLGHLDEVRALADTILAEHDEVHALVHNAGALVHERSEVDGSELTFAVHVVGPFLLTHLLRPALAAADDGRVVVVSSGGMYGSRLDLGNLDATKGSFNGTMAYSRAKRAQVILCELAADRLAGDGIAVSSMHPGWADTPGVVDSLPGFHQVLGPYLRTPEQGADTMVWLAAADGAATRSGRFFLDRAPRPTHKLPWTRATAHERQRLWDEVARRAGVDCR